MRAVRGLLLARVFSPGGFLLRATALAAFFLVLHVAGLRSHASIICGTSPTGTPPGLWTVFLGVAYIGMWFLVVVLAPALVIGSGIFLAALLAGRRREDRPS